MDELRESSLLFSLESLLETERERVQREAREAERKRAEELARVAELADRRRVAAQQEREARERRRLLEEERERLEAERLEAMKQGAVERARLEAESAARLIEAEQARQHELSLADLRARHGSARYRLLGWLGVGALGVSWAAAAWAYFGLIAPGHAEREAQAQALSAADAKLARAKEQALELERSRNQRLQAQLEALRAAPASAPGAPQVAPKPPVRGGGERKPPVGGVSSARECVDNGDPLNAELCQARRRR